MSIAIRLLLIASFTVLVASVSARNGRFDLGARANGMANASVTLGDSWSLFNNIGGLARVENTTAVFTYQNKYGIPEFNTFGGAFVSRRLILAARGIRSRTSFCMTKA